MQSPLCVFLVGLLCAAVAAAGVQEKTIVVSVAAVQSRPQGSAAANVSSNTAVDMAHISQLLQQLLASHTPPRLVVLPEALFWSYALVAANASQARTRMRQYALGLPPVGTRVACNRTGSLLQALSCLAQQLKGPDGLLVANVVAAMDCQGLAPARCTGRHFRARSCGDQLSSCFVNLQISSRLLAARPKWLSG